MSGELEWTGTRIVLVTPNFANNSLGRAFCLWMLARHLGMDVRVCGVKGSEIWAPLRGTDFAKDCVLPPAESASEALFEHIRAADLVIAVKPLPTSFGIARDQAEAAGVPFLLDIDDPDLEVRTAWLPWPERWARFLLKHRRYRDLRRLRTLAVEVPRIVSNPALQAMYGGEIVPHVRELPPLAGYSPSWEPVVRFVGSPRGHKGVAELRLAISDLSTEGFTLDVTGPRPEDANEWERWLDQTSMEEGADLVATADIIAIPSLVNSWSPAQLPAKLIDAMINGRAIVASRTPPIEWALGNAGILVTPGDVVGLTRALRTLEDPAVRRKLGARARKRATELFTVSAVAPTFERALREAKRFAATAPRHETPAPTAQHTERDPHHG